MNLYHNLNMQMINTAGGIWRNNDLSILTYLWKHSVDKRDPPSATVSGADEADCHFVVLAELRLGQGWAIIFFSPQGAKWEAANIVEGWAKRSKSTSGYVFYFYIEIS